MQKLIKILVVIAFFPAVSHGGGASSPAPPAYAPPPSYPAPTYTPPVPKAAPPPTASAGASGMVTAGSVAPGQMCPAPIPPAEPTVDFTTFTDNGVGVAAIYTPLISALQDKTVTDLGYSLYQQMAVANDDPVISVITNHVGNYCSPNLSAETVKTGGFVCKAKTGTGAAADAAYLEMGDINTYVLLEPLSYFTPALKSAAQNLIKNLTNPFPDNTYAKGVADTAKQSFANRLTDNAVLSVAFNSFNEMYGIRLPGNDSTLKVSGTKASSSKLMIMQDEATRRFEKPGFSVILADTKTTKLVVLKHIAAMKAFRLWMDYQRFRQGERIEALLAAGLSKYAVSSEAQQKMIKKAATGR